MKIPWFHRRRREADLDAEIRGHLNEAIRDRIERGETPVQARANALREFGNLGMVKEVTREMWGWSWIDRLKQDLGYGLRMLCKTPGFTLIAVFTLALGIGATTSVFSFVNAVLLRPLPVRDPASLVSVHKPGSNGGDIHSISYPDYIDYLNSNEVFSDLLVWSDAPASLNVNGQAEQAYGMVVSGNYFSMLGASPAAGRLFRPEEDRIPGAAPVMVISYTFWQSRFGGDPAIVGRSFLLNGRPFTIIGVAPRGFTSTYPVFAPAFYAPLMMQTQLMSQPDIFSARMAKYLKITGRLKPGVTREQAQTALSLLDRRLEEAYPQRGETSMQPNLGLELVPAGAYPGVARWAIFGAAGLLFALAGCVLLIACANVAGMLLARAISRRREMAVRLALGATRRRLIRQLLTESCLLFLAAGAIGAGLTLWLTRWLSTITVEIEGRFALEAKVDWRVLCFTLALAFVAGVIFSLAPALEASRADLTTVMKDAPGPGVFGRSRMRFAFVVGQIALSLTLLVGAGLFTRSLHYARTIYPGKNPESVLTASLDPRQQGYSTARAREFYQELVGRVTALPGVDAVSLGQILYAGPDSSTTGLGVRDAPQETNLQAEFNVIMPRYFQTLGIQLLSGRDFTPADRDSSLRVVIVNEALQRRFWPGASALGKQISAGGGEWAEIVGVVENRRYRIAGEAAPPFVYWPFLQSQIDNLNMTVFVRRRGDAPDLPTAVRRVTQTLDPNLPLRGLMTLSDAVQTATAPWRVMSTLANVLGLIGMSLAALGVYGLTAYTVHQRTHEIGVRVALGAQRRDIFKMILGGGLKLALFGASIGLALSLAFTRLLSSLLLGVSAADPATYLSVTLLLILAALTASFIPACHATKLDPLAALRSE